MSDYLKSDKAKSIWSSMRSNFKEDEEDKKEKEEPKEKEGLSRFAKLKKFARSQFDEGFGSDSKKVKNFGKRLFK